MKKCPFCAEEIQDEAIKCKHCGEMLNVPAAPVAPAHPDSDDHLPPPSKHQACPACRKTVSREASSCPHCGHLFKYSGALNMDDPVHVAGAVLSGLMVLAVIWACFQ